MIQRIKELVKTNKFLSLLSSGTSAVLGLATFSLLVRALSKEDFGFWGFFITVFTLFDMLRAGLLSQALIKNIAETTSTDNTEEAIGTGWRLSFKTSIIATLVVSPIFFGIYLYNGEEVYKLISLWFGAVALISVPHSLTTWVLTADLRFDRIALIRVALQLTLLIGVIAEYFLDFGLYFVFITFFAGHMATTLFTLWRSYVKLSLIKKASKKMAHALLSFGKYSMGTLIGSSLLRSSDTFIIFSFLGPTANAVYMVPERLVNLFDVPLQALVSLGFPSLIQKYKTEGEDGFKREFELSAGFSSLMLIPISILTFIFAEDLVVLLGGAEYENAADILRIFAVYTALTPIDRFSGIALDVLHRPHLNFYKVMAMLAANIIGDLIVIQFTDNIAWIAFISIITFATGILFGFVFLRDVIPFNPLRILFAGSNEIKRLVRKYVGK